MTAPHLDYTPDDLDLEVAQLLQSGVGDPLDDPDTLRALAKLRLQMGQDVIFISSFKGSSRVLELVESPAASPLKKVAAGVSRPQLTSITKSMSKSAFSLRPSRA